MDILLLWLLSGLVGSVIFRLCTKEKWSLQDWFIGILLGFITFSISIGRALQVLWQWMGKKEI